MQTIICKDELDLSKRLAEWWIKDMQLVLATNDIYTIALAGGNTPKKLYELIATKYLDSIDWSRVHFFFGDERYVPLTDEKSNAKMAFDVLLNRIPADKNNIHIMQTSGREPGDSAADYDKLLHSYFDGQPHTFDLVLLGLGSDAHTLSLFPGHPVVSENKKWVSTFYLDEQEMHRITLTAPVVNMAAKVAFMVSGGSKAAALYHVRASEHDPDLYPAQIIQPFNGELYWFVDDAAGADL